MTDNILVPLPGFTLPCDFAWKVRFIDAVEDHLQKLHAAGHFVPPRFFGYYFNGGQPVAVSGGWTVALDRVPALERLPAAVARLTDGRFAICAEENESQPDFLLIHDRRDGACWLWRFSFGLRFVAATEPIFDRAA